MDKAEILKRAKDYILAEKDERFRKEVEELVLKEDMKELEDRFYRTLEFGTGGLRGIMGGGTNRMNTLEINLATQGLANYVIKANPEKAKDGKLSAVVAYDSPYFCRKRNKGISFYRSSPHSGTFICDTTFRR